MRIRLAGVALLILLSGCSSPHPTATPPPATMQTPQDNLPPPTSIPPAKIAPADVARAAMTVFVNHGLSSAQWIDGLAPYLSPQALADWAGTDPMAVPAHKLGATAVQSATTYLTTVTQDTDAGMYALILSRRDDGSWQIERIIPPQHGPVTP